MKNDAMKRTAGRPRSQIDHNLKGKRTVEIITEETGESPKQVQRYITLTKPDPGAFTTVAEKMNVFVRQLQNGKRQTKIIRIEKSGFEGAIDENY